MYPHVFRIMPQKPSPPQGDVTFYEFLSRDWFEDELRYFQGGEDGLAPSVWESKVSSFPLVSPMAFW